LPFDDDNLQVLLNKVKAGSYVMPSFLPDDVKDLISRMLCLNPKERITIREIKKHPWWKKMIALEKEREKASASVPATTIAPVPAPAPVLAPAEATPVGTTKTTREEPSSTPLVTPHPSPATFNELASPVMRVEPIKVVPASPTLTTTHGPDDMIELEHVPTNPQGDDDEDEHHPLPEEEEGEDVEYGDDDDETSPPASPDLSGDATPTGKKKKSALHKPLSADNIDEEIFHTIVNMGWKDEAKLRESLTSKRTNIETVLYHLLEKRKAEQGSASLKVESFHPSLSVNPGNPIKDNVDNAAILRQRLAEAAMMRDDKMKGDLSSSPKKASWFAFWKKKPAVAKKQEDKVSTFGLHSMKKEQEIINELARSFTVLQIHWNRLSENSIRAKLCTENDNPVEFDISMTDLPNNAGYVLTFSRVAGDPFTARILFDVLQQELNL
jgi:hypothetical protein